VNAEEQEEAPPEEEPARVRTEAVDVDTTGTISVIRNDRGKIDSIRFTGEDGVSFTIRYKGNGRMLGTADGKRVALKGRARDVKGESILDVQTFRILP